MDAPKHTPIPVTGASGVREEVRAQRSTRLGGASSGVEPNDRAGIGCSEFASVTVSITDVAGMAWRKVATAAQKRC